MKRRILSFHVLLAMSLAGLAGHAGAAPKEKATPTPSPTATPAPTPTPTPTAAPAATATPNPAATPNYNGAQQAQYIATAREAFVVQRSLKSQPYIEATAAFEAAGGVSPKGLKTKEDIAARRDLLAKVIAANDAYLEFVKTQEDTYRTELAKTPLVPSDVDSLVQQFAEHANTPKSIQLRALQTETLKAGDDSLAALDKKFGAWTATDAGKITFKKPADVKAMNALNMKYNAKVTDLNKLHDELAAAAASASPSPSASPGVSPAASPAGAPGAAPTASATIPPPATPAPSVKK